MQKYEICPICGAEPYIIRVHDCIFVECPDCEAADALCRWCEEHTDLPLRATSNEAEAVEQWADMCAAYYATHAAAAA